MWQRRHFLGWLGATLAAAPGLGASALAAPTTPRRPGRLLVIGGAEDRLNDRVILRRFVQLCSGHNGPASEPPHATEAQPDRAPASAPEGSAPHILVLTAASGFPEESWQGYAPVFAELGANASHLDLRSPQDAEAPEALRRILSADGIFMSGGDQSRLMATLWESAAARAMHTAFHLRGCCIAGTSAGAAAQSRLMLATGDATALPYQASASLDIGLGFIQNAIVDQHFSERRRLGRLLSALAYRPDIIGVGVDENTALLIERDLAIEVIGQGAVTLVDGRQMRSNLAESDPDAPLEMLDVKLHLLPAGHRYPLRPAPGDRALPPGLRQAVAQLVRPGPIRG